MRIPNYGEVRKLFVFAATVMGNALTLGVVPEGVQVWTFLFLNVAGAYGIYAMPNDDGPVN